MAIRCQILGSVDLRDTVRDCLSEWKKAKECYPHRLYGRVRTKGWNYLGWSDSWTWLAALHFGERLRALPRTVVAEQPVAALPYSDLFDRASALTWINDPVVEPHLVVRQSVIRLA